MVCLGLTSWPSPNYSRLLRSHLSVDIQGHLEELCTWLLLCFGFILVSSCIVLVGYWLIFTHNPQGYFTGTGAIIWLPQCPWSNPEGYGKMHHMKPPWAELIWIEPQPNKAHQKMYAVCIGQTLNWASNAMYSLCVLGFLSKAGQASWSQPAIMPILSWFFYHIDFLPFASQSPSCSL